jgi:hypothetical protein
MVGSKGRVWVRYVKTTPITVLAGVDLGLTNPFIYFQKKIDLEEKVLSNP